MKKQRNALLKKEMILFFGMRNPKKKPNPIRFLVWPLIFISFGPFLWFLTMIMTGLHGALKTINQIPFFFTMFLTVTQLLLFLNAVPTLMGRFYGNRDNEILLPMPIPAGDILFSRFVPILITQMLLAAFFIGPVYFVHIRAEGFHLHEAVAMLTGYLSSVIFPTAVGAVSVLLLMRYTNVGKYRDRLKTIGLFLIVALSIGFQFLAQSSLGQNADLNLVLRVLTDNQALITMFGSIFPSSRWTGIALASSGGMSYLYSGLNLLLMVASSVLTIWIGKSVYLKSLLAGEEMLKETKKDVSELQTGATRPVLSIFRYELRMILRTPAYAVNVLSSPFIFSIIWILPFVANAEIRQSVIPLIRKFASSYVSADLGLWIALAAGIVLGFILSTFSETSTSISREGENIWIQRVLPIRIQDQIFGRSLVNLSIIGLASMMSIVLSWILLRYPSWVMLIIFLTSLFFSLPMTLAGLAIDAKRPKLHWSDPNEAVKQNLNSLFGVIAMMAYAAIFAGVAYGIYRLSKDFGFILRTCVLVYFMINAVATVILYLTTKKTMQKTFRTLE